MTTAEQVLGLVDSHYRRDEPRFRAIVHQILSHNPGVRLRRGLERCIQSHSAVPIDLSEVNPRTAQYWQRVEPAELSELVVPQEVEARLQWILEQHRSSDRLRDAGMEPPQRLLFHGPPGVGKSMSARILAKELDLPAVMLKMDTVVRSHVGESAQALRDALGLATVIPAVFILDEIDSIGATRSDHSDAADLEHARTLNVLLSSLDSAAFSGPVVATTNRVDLLDLALLRRWRKLRFWATLNERSRLAERYGIHWQDLGDVPELSLAEVVAVCEEAQRIRCLSCNEGPSDRAAQQALHELELTTKSPLTAEELKELRQCSRFSEWVAGGKRGRPTFAARSDEAFLSLKAKGMVECEGEITVTELGRKALEEHRGH